MNLSVIGTDKKEKKEQQEKYCSVLFQIVERRDYYKEKTESDGIETRGKVSPFQQRRECYSQDKGNGDGREKVI